MSFVAKKDTSAYVNLMFYSFILRNILSTMCTVADIRWLCYTFNSGIYALAPRLNAMLPPEGKNIRYGSRMLIIRMLIQILL